MDFSSCNRTSTSWIGGPTITTTTTVLPKFEFLIYRSLPLVLSFLIIYLIWFANFFSLPHIMDSDTNGLSYWLCLTVLIYLEVSFLYSLIMCVRTDPSIRKLVLITKCRGDWTYCTICQTLRPPRTHHCHSCGVCVIRRDHHCGLLGQCIGLANWRYFFNTLTYGFLASALMAYLNMHLVFGSYLIPDQWSLRFRLLCMLVPPGLFWLLGFLTFWETAMFVSTSLTVIISCLLLCFALHQLHLAIRNQTMSERTTRCESVRIASPANAAATNTDDYDTNLLGPCVNLIHSTPMGLYDLGLAENVGQFFGKRWFLAIVFPWVRSDLTTDGMDFAKSK